MMAKIVAEKGCGNSPKAKFILDFLISLANMDVEKTMEMLDDDAQLNMVGRESYAGKDEIKAFIVKDGAHTKMTKLEVSKILSHGKHCAANGIMHFEDGGTVAFNNMYTFSSHSKNARLKFVEVYSIELE